MALQTFEIEIVVEKVLDFGGYARLDGGDLIVLLLEQYGQILLAVLFVVIHDLAEFGEVLLHLGLDDLAVSLLDSLKVLLGLNQLVLSVVDKNLSALHPLFDFVHDAGNDLDLG